MSRRENMGKKTISVPDPKREYIRYVIARYNDTSWAEQILCELVDNAKDGIVQDPHAASQDIQLKLGIDDLMYRQQIHKLKAKRFIKRHGHVLILHPMLALEETDLDQITITRMARP